MSLRATTYYQRALDLSPRYAPAANGLGAMKVHRGFRWCRATVPPGARWSPNYPPAILNLAAIYESKKDVDMAIKVLQQGLEANPTAQNLAAKLITTYVQHGRLPEAKRLILQQLEASPNDTELIGGLGIIAHSARSYLLRRSNSFSECWTSTPMRPMRCMEW